MFFILCTCPGFATMWSGLEVAAKNITTSVAAETVTTVKHKYVYFSFINDSPLSLALILSTANGSTLLAIQVLDV